MKKGRFLSGKSEVQLGPFPLSPLLSPTKREERYDSKTQTHKVSKMMSERREVERGSLRDEFEQINNETKKSKQIVQWTSMKLGGRNPGFIYIF